MGVVKLFDKSKLELISKKNNVSLDRKLSISFIRDFLFFFNIKQEDLPKLISYSEELEKNRRFVLENKKYFETLTSKEKEVFTLVIKGKSSCEIADSLFIETSTVSTHRKRIKQKLNLTSIFDWYNYAKAFELL